jgi:cell wall assembly regulator SMI1
VECRAGRVSFRAAPGGDSAAFGQATRLWQTCMDPLQRLDAALREPGDDRMLVMEVAVGAGRTVEFSYSFGLASASPYSVVLDREYRYPNHPRPGMPRPAAARPTGRPTDPDVLRHIDSLVREFAGHYRRVTGRAPRFGQIRSEHELAAAEEAMGLRLPEDVRALHRLAGDDPHEVGLLGRYRLLPLPAVVSRYVDGAPGAWGWHDGLFGFGRVVLDAHPPGVVRRVSRNDWWVVIASDFSGNECAVDLDPAPEGRPGQLIEYGRDFPCPVNLVAESATAQLTAVLEALRRGHDHLQISVPPISSMDWEHAGSGDVATVVATSTTPGHSTSGPWR